MKKNNTILFILKIYALVLSIFFIFRLILFFTELNRIVSSTENNINLAKAFVMGVRFDLVISSYIMLLPVLIILIQAIINQKSRIINKIIFYWIFILFSISFLISSADIPYFNQFFARFSIGAFEWIDNTGFVFKMIFQEPKYFMFSILAIIIILIFYKLLHLIFIKNHSLSNTNIFIKIIISLSFIFLLLISIRGRVEQKSPIRIGTAYFCNDPFINQLGLNPTFTFLRSYLNSLKEDNKRINLMDNDLAIKNIQKYLKIDTLINNSPIARKITPNKISQSKPNIVLIIMESMSAAKMKRFGNKNNLTPFLDSLSYQSYFFENIYTAGEHTYNGIFSTLFSFPALYRHHPLKSIKKYDGIAKTLRSLGYSTSYFTTHDGQFDNIEGFLRTNDFENIISQADYPAEEIKTTLGVPDDYMFRYSIPVINKLNKKNKAFFVTFMTTSDHGPYYIPEYFKPHNTDIKKQVTEYADWSLKKFIKMASKTKWFDNTIFVFIADHGAAMDVHYDISLNYHHSPLIFYAPKLLKPKLFSNIGGQIDVYPTIMGLLKKEYINNTLGIDLINETRPYILINGDDKVAVLNNDFLLILKDDNSKKLFKYKTKAKTNYIKTYPEKAEEMETYLRSNLQIFNTLSK